LLMVRNTETDAYPAHVRAEYIKHWMLEKKLHGTIMIIPNVEGVYWGREVGYHVGQIDVDAKTKTLSASNIRNRIANSLEWIDKVATKNSSHLLTPNISKIIDDGLVVWLTGYPSSGKTTIAKALIRYISTHYPHLKYQLLDGDIMRASPLAKDVGFGKNDRAKHILRMAYLASMFAQHGIFTICAFVSPDRAIRIDAKKIIGEKKFIEVYVKASKKIRLIRDPKGMYKKAVTGKLKQFTGIDAPYEAPRTPNVICNTDKESVEESVEKIAKVVFH
jgi:adenylylsulfate kinase